VRDEEARPEFLVIDDPTYWVRLQSVKDG